MTTKKQATAKAKTDAGFLPHSTSLRVRMTRISSWRTTLLFDDRSYSTGTEVIRHGPTLFDGEFGVVAVAGDDGVLLGVAFFVLHAQGVAFVVDQKDLDLAVAAVVLVVGGAVGEDVLVADGVVDLGEDVGER